jgi:hypothetical protein
MRAWRRAVHAGARAWAAQKKAGLKARGPGKKKIMPWAVMVWAM